MTSNTEHRIQTLFGNIQLSSDSLKEWQKNTINLLEEAWRNEWKENLSGKIWESFEWINLLALSATENSIQLRKILESSQYKNIFNFAKYSNWIKIQVLEPIESMLILLGKNSSILKKTISSLDSQISNTSDSTSQKILILQKERLEIQIDSFDKTIAILKQYQQKLI